MLSMGLEHRAHTYSCAKLGKSYYMLVNLSGFSTRRIIHRQISCFFFCLYFRRFDWKNGLNYAILRSFIQRSFTHFVHVIEEFFFSFNSYIIPFPFQLIRANAIAYNLTGFGQRDHKFSSRQVCITLKRRSILLLLQHLVDIACEMSISHFS